jgi:hypothetical protein
MVQGTPYVIVDICLRMLKPPELYKAQRFPAGYIIDLGAGGKPVNITQQVREPAANGCAGTGQRSMEVNARSYGSLNHCLTCTYRAYRLRE